MQFYTIKAKKRAKMHQIEVEENLRRIFITNKYTKTLRPLFGLDRHIDKSADLYNLLALKEDITEQIKKHEPRIQTDSISFEDDNGSIICEISYTQDKEAKFLRLNI